MRTDPSIRQHILFVALAPAVVVAIGLTLYFLVLRLGDADAALAARGAALLRQFAPAAAAALQREDGVELERLVQALKNEADVNAVAVADDQGRPIASAGRLGNGGGMALRPDGWHGATDDGAALLFHAKLQRPDGGADNPLGSATLEISLAGAQAAKREVLTVALLVGLAMLAAAGILALHLGGTIVATALVLKEALMRIRRGDYDTPIPVHAEGTLGGAEAAINELAADLKERQRNAAVSIADHEAELARQLRFAQGLLDAQARSGIGLAIIEFGRVVFANAAVERMSGYSLEELRELPHFVQIAHPDDRELILRHHLGHLAGQDIEDRYDFMLLRRDGGTRHIQLVQTSIATGEHVQVLAILLDITERKRAESQLAETHRQMLARKEDAERMSRGKSRFLAAAGHDLRQPLHALMLFAAELETTAATADQKRLAAQIGTATGAMGEILDSLLEVSRLDTANVTPHRAPLPLAPLLAGIADAHRQSASAKGLRLRCVPTQVWVDSDPHLLRRLVSNLVANAVRYTSRGGIVLGVRRAGGRLRIEVWDSGIGIPAEHLSQVFQEFYQVDNGERDAGKGLGLGLSIVDRIARILGHPLQARSWPGQGSVFGVTVPRAKPVAMATAPLPAAASAATVLVVSETAPVLESLGNLVQNWGYRVQRADSERLMRVRLGAAPDLVICDECCFLALQDALEKRPPPRPQVVLVGDPQPAGQRLKLFIDGRIAKPVRPARLRALLHHLLEEPAAESGGADGPPGPEGPTA